MTAVSINAATAEFERLAEAVRKDLKDHVADRGKLAVVKAPPGSGKTTLLISAAEHAYKLGYRVAVATQTNSQADDICSRIARHHPRVRAVRFAGKGHTEMTFGPNVGWATDADLLPTKKCIVVGTSAKWGLVTINHPFEFVFVEEAWQLANADFMLLAQVASRFVLIGDPGQIPPVVSVDASRWETAPRAPHRPAPEVVLRSQFAKIAKVFELPATRRLPFDSVPFVRPFYDFEFGGFAQAGDRRLETRAGGRRAVDRVVEKLRGSSVAALTIPTADSGPPLDADEELAEQSAAFVRRLLSSEVKIVIDGKRTALSQADIGVVSTHRSMNATVRRQLDEKRLTNIRVDTPERWQGLELPIMVAVHPLSGVTHPSSFDLETGRLCVMASRHRVSVIVVTRDHVGETLRNLIPAADQPVGRDDVNGRGHASNLMFWEQLERNDLIVSP